MSNLEVERCEFRRRVPGGIGSMGYAVVGCLKPEGHDGPHRAAIGGCMIGATEDVPQGTPSVDQPMGWYPTTYSEHDETRPLPSEETPHLEGEGEVCPQCGEGTLTTKRGRFGAFVGCSAIRLHLHPARRAAAPEQLPFEVPAPGTVTATWWRRRARRTGNVFYGCSSYPKCDFTTNLVPTGAIHDAHDDGKGAIGRRPDDGLCLTCGAAVRCPTATWSACGCRRPARPRGAGATGKDDTPTAIPPATWSAARSGERIRERGHEWSNPTSGDGIGFGSTPQPDDRSPAIELRLEEWACGIYRPRSRERLLGSRGLIHINIDDPETLRDWVVRGVIWRIPQLRQLALDAYEKKHLVTREEFVEAAPVEVRRAYGRARRRPRRLLGRRTSAARQEAARQREAKRYADGRRPGPGSVRSTARPRCPRPHL